MRPQKVSLCFLFVILTFFGCAGHAARTKKINTIVQTARSYTGVPYKFGGTTRAGMDCSALIYHAYRGAGIVLPRTSAEQAKKGVKSKLKELQVGDLVFFATGNKKRKVTHAGIVTAIRGKKDVRFIHASSSLGVIESNLYSPYYIQRFLRARRIL